MKVLKQLSIICDFIRDVIQPLVWLARLIYEISDFFFVLVFTFLGSVIAILLIFLWPTF